MPTINGTKMACEPCIRGHRSTSCTHEDSRVMVPVRKPGRPLTGCTHPRTVKCSSCSSRGDAITIAIPRKRKCECTGDSASSGDRDVKYQRQMATAPTVAESNGSDSALTPASTTVMGSVTSPSKAMEWSANPSQTWVSPLSSVSTPGRDGDSKTAIESVSSSSKGTPERSSCCSRKPSVPQVSPQIPPQQSCCGSKPRMLPPASSQTVGAVHPPAAMMPHQSPSFVPPRHPFHSIHVDGNQTPPGSWPVIPGVPTHPLAVTLPLCTDCMTNTQATFLIYPHLHGYRLERAEPTTLQQQIGGSNIVYVTVPSAAATSSNLSPVPVPLPVQAPNPRTDINMPQPAWIPNTVQQSPITRPHTGSLCNNTDLLHECHCGPGCQCLGCVDHPFNSATEAYVQSAFNFGNIEWDEMPGMAGQLTPQEEGSDDVLSRPYLAGGNNGVGASHSHDEHRFLFVDFPINSTNAHDTTHNANVAHLSAT
ncbi:hypothetical protein F5Y15DRAFT_78518 [Xylariaceae sp. FL0016]|nr:hypothetical protein F5Y15DRAFT_78518 [Xylariaceae sp. FL0016]